MARYCFWIDPTQDVSDGRGYIPSMVTEGEPGHTPMGLRDSDGVTSPRPWFWGPTLEAAQATCDTTNTQRLGLTPADALDIVLSSMVAQNEDEDDILVTCDNCDATSEAGWGDSPLCLDCEAPENICQEHHLTRYAGLPCPVCQIA